MFQWINEAVSYVQFSEPLRWVLLFISAVLSALLTEMIFENRDWTSFAKKLVERMKKWPFLQKWLGKWKWTAKRERTVKWIEKWLRYSSICFMVFLLNVLLTMLLLYIILQFKPQQESFWVLIQKIARTQTIDFVFPIIAALVASWALNSKQSKKHSANLALCILLVLTTTLSSFMYFIDSFRMIQHPKYSVPIESISSIMNSRLNVYPFALTEESLTEMGDGSNLLSDDSQDSNVNEPTGSPAEIKEPTDFRGYISAIADGIFVPGKDKKDYLLCAYELFLSGKHNNDYFYMGMMWHFIHDNLEWFADDPSITGERCLEEALAAYGEYENLHGGSPALYSNMALIYHMMGQRGSTREYLNKALNSNGNKDFTISVYTGYIYSWIGDEDISVLLNDAAVILNYKKNLSMYVLYGACAVAQNSNVETAYRFLNEADIYYNGRSAMVKILKCICADLLGTDVDGNAELQQIYNLESTNGFIGPEEIYLMRYLFLTNRFDELWGYIADVGSAEDAGKSDVQSLVLKASWYAKNSDKVYSDKEAVEQLLQQIDDKLATVSQEDEKDDLLLAQLLLKNCLGESVSSDLNKIEPKEASDLQYVFYTTDVFNKGDYLSAITYCDAFFDAEKRQEQSNSYDLLSLQQLEPQEQMTLHYYIQLIYAESHFQYACTGCIKYSKEWKKYMEKAEKECSVFKQSSKSLFYIGEQFRALQDKIDMENGKLPEQVEENPS